jgi:hypothetical protein
LRAPAFSENPNSIIPLLYEAKINRLLDYNRTHGRQHGDIGWSLLLPQQTDEEAV